ncbi:hypothetical protein BU24DRAFT_173756 [Aaosphaeria arxii CBS 175.79]|uniref:DNA/RNA-binding domain-containing protein n=1 Tax=Aaosphaeria arxii CBS 175.79 TaxID=1450172 RepID=A0A6A5XR96_9PLEO|nr:uncharacterized protein BU24DRAFT_173756 [Aaosphaeria arxii CBS 175.79]KAF2015220.1 hypothetical protein BU24DRAFT_173756 [Aaosphaeria arxii CBS 175.79]
MAGNVDVHSRWVNALRTQAKTTETFPSEPLPCPYCNHPGRIFQSADQVFDHAKADHASLLQAMDPNQARARVVKDAVEKANAGADRSSEATAGGGSTPDLGALSLNPVSGRDSLYSSKKRPAESDFQARRGKNPGPVQILDPDYSRDLPYNITSDRTTRSKHVDPRLFDPKQGAKGTVSPYRSTPEPSSEWSVEANRSQLHFKKGASSPNRQPFPKGSTPKSSPKQHTGHTQHRQRGLIELQKSDPRFPDLLLQPDSRPISQEQLASEVKSIYAGLTMVENKCVEVNEKEKQRLNDADGKPLSNLACDQWQALIALHRTLLHEHHDFFLASQHPSASSALRRLPAKYSMPARMWKHGIHQFLELLRLRLPESLDYMLAFIYLAYQMVALLYETVPAFEDTWIECLGDLGRYRMAVEDEDLRDRETWAGVARSWYSKAADKNPSIGRLYHHLAILARPNALQQLAYYCRSLTCVVPFDSARESILTLLNPVLDRNPAAFSQGLPIDIRFIQAHAILFKKLSPEDFEDARQAFQSQLDNHINRVTAKWKEQGVFIGITNIAGLFDYGSNESILREIVVSHYRRTPQRLSQSSELSKADNEASEVIQPGEDSVDVNLLQKLESLSSEFTFSRAYHLTMSTMEMVCRRIGDKNVLPHIHVVMSFLSAISSISSIAHFLNDAPWAELVTSLNELLKAEQAEQVLPSPMFPPDQVDSVPLPEDYTIRGQVWSQSYFPSDWFAREHDEEDRPVELASTIRSRIERILRIAYQISTFNRWISYDAHSHKFSVLISGQSS